MPAHQRGVLTSQGALAEDAIRLSDHLAKWQRHTREAAEQCVEVHHPHGRGYTLARHIAKNKEELSIGGDQIAIVAADGTDRSVMIAGLPVPGAQIHLRQ